MLDLFLFRPSQLWVQVGVGVALKPWSAADKNGNGRSWSGSRRLNARKKSFGIILVIKPWWRAQLSKIVHWRSGYLHPRLQFIYWNVSCNLFSSIWSNTLISLISRGYRLSSHWAVKSYNPKSDNDHTECCTNDDTLLSEVLEIRTRSVRTWGKFPEKRICLKSDRKIIANFCSALFV